MGRMRWILLTCALMLWAATLKDAGRVMKENHTVQIRSVGGTQAEKDRLVLMAESETADETGSSVGMAKKAV